MSPHRHGSPECRRVFERLSEYLDHELDDELMALVEDHNADCVACQRFLDSLRTTVELLGDQAEDVLPARARHAVHADYEAWRERAGSSDDS